MRGAGRVSRRFFEPLRATGGSREPKRAPLRERRRRKRLLIAGGTVALGIVLLFTVRYVLYLPQYRIHIIEIYGSNELDPQSLEHHVRDAFTDNGLRFYPRDSIFFYDKDAVRASLLAGFSLLREARVARTGALSQTLAVEVEEREPFAYWCPAGTNEQEAECSVMDAEGYVYALAHEVAPLPEGAYRFRGHFDTADVKGRSFIEGRMSWVMSLFSELQATGYTPRGGEAEGRDLYIDLAEGFMLKTSFETDPKALAQSLSLVLGSDTLVGRLGEIEYVDLRFGTRVYYKLKGSASDAAASAEDSEQ